LAKLPYSCVKAAQVLRSQADAYTKYGVFTHHIIENIARKLESFQDENLREQLTGNNEATMKLVLKYLHCG